MVTADPMDDNQLLRYSRQIMMPDIGIEGQQRLTESRVLIIGMGGLGSPVATYLAAAGVGQLVIVDHDVVDLTNLQRQFIHHTGNVGDKKVSSAQRRLLDMNPEIQITAIDHKLESEELDAQIGQADVVVDCTDNFTVRFAINEACVKARKPLVSGAVIRMEGQVSVFCGYEHNLPCYHCLYKDEGELHESCSETGILAPVAGIIGSIQATETLKILLDLGDTLVGRVQILDAITMEWRSLKLKKDPQCPTCHQ